MAAMKSPILSGATVLTFCSVCPARFTSAALPGVSIRPVASGIRRRTGHVPLSQTVPVMWATFGLSNQTSVVLNAKRETRSNRFRRRRELEEFGREPGVLHDWEKLIK